jgi:hypothetical protein
VRRCIESSEDGHRAGLSTSGAIFLIEEMSTPLDGVVKVSLDPMRNALAHLGE